MKMATDRVTSAATTARPYVERAISDDELRASVKSAFEAVREVYGDLVGDRKLSKLATRVASDEDIHENLATAISELRHAADRLQGKHEHHGRNKFVVTAGLVLIALFNPITGPATRKWLTGLVGGGGDEYAYSGSNGAPN